MFAQLWNDETGAVITSELVLIVSIVVIGGVTGLSTARDALVTELADLGAAVANIDQSYSVGGIQSDTGYSTGFGYYDQRDPGDGMGAGTPPHPRGIIICTSAFGGEAGNTGPANPGIPGGGGTNFPTNVSPAGIGPGGSGGGTPTGLR